jgi:hypothetical protein
MAVCMCRVCTKQNATPAVPTCLTSKGGHLLAGTDTPTAKHTQLPERCLAQCLTNKIHATPNDCANGITRGRAQLHAAHAQGAAQHRHGTSNKPQTVSHAASLAETALVHLLCKPCHKSNPVNQTPQLAPGRPHGRRLPLHSCVSMCCLVLGHSLVPHVGPHTSCIPTIWLCKPADER